MATKKTTTKKAPAKKKPAVKQVSKSTKAKSSRVLAIQPEQEDFMNFRVNRETVYWVVLGAVVILFALWIMQLQSDIQKLYDDIDASTAASNEVNTVPAKQN